jgi:hypothetical protein
MRVRWIKRRRAEAALLGFVNSPPTYIFTNPMPRMLIPVGPDTTHGHGGLGDHYHIYQMFKFDGKCQWQYLGGKVGKGVLDVPPAGMSPCSSYPGFQGR